jgi:hypothetical protein
MPVTFMPFRADLHGRIQYICKHIEEDGDKKQSLFKTFKDGGNKN